ncbi:MAG TPA: bifunctional ADP-heptose synthase, partial [Planctomycetaceae bacterium]
MSYKLVELVQRLGEPNVLVLGDVILDRYVWGDAERISQEAPVILLREDKQEVRLGGAANVANMLRGLEAKATIASVTGSDPDAATLRGELAAAGVDCGLLVEDATRPTTVKLRYIGRAQHRHPHQILRVDREVRMPVSDEVADRLWAAIEPRLGEFGSVLISDYAKGVCTPALVRRVIDAAKGRGLPVIVDPASTGDCTAYRGATALTPNRLETGRAAKCDVKNDADAFAAGRRLVREHDLDHIYVTLDSDGIAVVKRDGSAVRLPTRKRQVYDITGAGDMVLATIGVGAAAGIGPEDLARLANVAGGLEVEKIGCVPVTRDEILADLLAHHRGGDGEKVVGSLD